MKQREIEYRGLTSKGGKWAYGSLVLSPMQNKAVIIEQTRRDSIHQTNSHWSIDVPAYRVIPKTIGLYTGFKDKNDKRIYEGDIVGNGKFKWIVVFRHGCFKLKHPHIEPTKWSPDADIWGALETMISYSTNPNDELFYDQFEVIGNIHESKVTQQTV